MATVDKNSQVEEKLNNTRFRPQTAIAIVIASMVGTGVFTSLGFQLVDIRSPFALLMLWLVGGFTALCGALTYAELGAAIPRSGGEYNFLSRIYHPSAGFISGWVSATVGFAAPTALVAITFGSYLSAVFPVINPTWAAAILVLTLGLVHCTNRRNSSELQQVFTLLKLAVIVSFCALALFFNDNPQPISLIPHNDDWSALFSSAFAVSLIYVNYAYTGWNAATYIIDELDEPQKSLPFILTTGTCVVLLLYLALNYTFLRVAPMEAMVGKIEIGYIAAEYAFGGIGAQVMGVILAALLISTVSAMVLAGPRVLQVIGQDFHAFRFFSRVNSSGIPVIAIGTQVVLSLILILTASFERILVFSGFILGLNTLFAVAGIFILRFREPDLDRPYRTFAFPLPPLIFMAITCWTLVYILLDRPEEGLMGIGLVVFGGLFYKLTSRFGEH